MPKCWQTVKYGINNGIDLKKLLYPNGSPYASFTGGLRKFKK